MGQIKRWDGKCIQYEIPFFVAYGIYLIMMICRTSFFRQCFPESAYKGVLLLCLLLLFAKEYLDGEFHLLLLFCLAVIAGMVLIIHKDAAFTTAFFLAFLFCGRDIPFERIAKVTVWISSALLLLIILSAEAGLITNYVMDENGDRPREFLGFLYALYPSAYLTNIISLEIYLKKHKIPIVELLLFFGVNYWIYVKTDSRLSFMMTAAVIGLGVLLKLVKCFSMESRYTFNPLIWIFNLGASASFILCAIGSIWLQVAYDPSITWMSKLNKIFTGRLYNGNASIEKYGVSMFGQFIEWVGNGLDESGQKNMSDYLYVDCSYLQVLQHYGILIMFLMMLILTITMIYCCYQKKYVLTLLMISIAGHMMIDDLVLHLWYNTFWFVCAQCILKPKVKSNLEEEKYEYS